MNRYQHLIDACHSEEQLAELACMCAAHAIQLASQCQGLPSSAAQRHRASERLRDLLDTGRQCETKLQRIVRERH